MTSSLLVDVAIHFLGEPVILSGFGFLKRSEEDNPISSDLARIIKRQGIRPYDIKWLPDGRLLVCNSVSVWAIDEPTTSKKVTRLFAKQSFVDGILAVDRTSGAIYLSGYDERSYKIWKLDHDEETVEEILDTRNR